jgi:hypothetical protein
VSSRSVCVGVKPPPLAQSLLFMGALDRWGACRRAHFCTCPPDLVCCRACVGVTPFSLSCGPWLADSPHIDTHSLSPERRSGRQGRFLVFVDIGGDRMGCSPLAPYSPVAPSPVSRSPLSCSPVLFFCLFSRSSHIAQFFHTYRDEQSPYGDWSSLSYTCEMHGCLSDAP